MGALNLRTSPKGTPLLDRLSQLEEEMDTLEGKYSPRGLAADLRSPKSPYALTGSPTTPSTLARRCRPVKSVLLETKEKGTLFERIQRLERRLNQHSVDLEKAFPGVQLHFSQFEPKCWEPDHIREVSKHLESPSRGEAQNTVQGPGSLRKTTSNHEGLEVSSTFTPSEENGLEELKELTDDATSRGVHQGLEDERSIQSMRKGEDVDAGQEKNASESGTRESKPEETTTSGTSKIVPTHANAKDVEKGHSGEKTDVAAFVEKPLVEEMNKPGPKYNTKKDTAKRHLFRTKTEQRDSTKKEIATGQKDSKKKDAATDQNDSKKKHAATSQKDSTQKDAATGQTDSTKNTARRHLFRTKTGRVEERSSLPRRETDKNLAEQDKTLSQAAASTTAQPITPFMQKELKHKRSFKHMRDRVQRLFGHKEALASGDTGRSRRFSSTREPSTTGDAVGPTRFGSV